MKKLLLVLFAIFCGVTLSAQNHSRSTVVKSKPMTTKAAKITSAKAFNSFTVSAPVIYTNKADFLAAIGSKNYLEDFNSYSNGTIDQLSLTLTSGLFGYTMTATPQGYVYSLDGAIGPNYDRDTLIITNNNHAISYFGGNFYTTDTNFGFISSVVSIVVGDYTYSFTCTNSTSFLGFVFPETIPSFGVVGDPAGYAWSTVDNLYVGYSPAITLTTSTLTTPEDTPLTLSLSDVTYTDIDPDPVTLIVQTGDNYTFDGTTITPAANFNGPLQVAVKVTDGTALSETAYITVNVIPVNDAPVISATGTVTTNEDTPVTLTLSDITASDVDGDALTLIVESGANYTFDGTTVTPATNYNGTLIVPVKVYDGTAYSAPANLTINVIAVNDVPVISATSVVTTDEDTPVTLTLSDITASDVDGDALTLIVEDGDNYTFIGTTITPAANYNGTLIVPVKVYDGTAYSASVNLTVNVIAVNDAPVIVSTSSVTTPEDTPVTLTLSDITATDVDGDALSVLVLSGDNYTFNGATVIPAVDFNGPLQVGVQVSDGTASSAVAYVEIDVTPVNDAPVITSTPITTATQSTLYTYTIIATDVDNTTLTYSVSGQPSGMTITDNVISWTPGTGIITSGEITVTVSDGSLTATQKFTITVTPSSGIYDPSADSFTISPNPATDMIKIEAGSIISSVQIIDITGKVIRTEVFDDTVVNLYINNLSNGFYFVKVKLGNSIKVKKLIKQ